MTIPWLLFMNENIIFDKITYLVQLIILQLKKVVAALNHEVFSKLKNS